MLTSKTNKLLQYQKEYLSRLVAVATPNKARLLCKFHHFIMSPTKQIFGKKWKY